MGGKEGVGGKGRKEVRRTLLEKIKIRIRIRIRGRKCHRHTP